MNLKYSDWEGDQDQDGLDGKFFHVNLLFRFLNAFDY